MLHVMLLLLLLLLLLSSTSYLMFHFRALTESAASDPALNPSRLKHISR